MFDILHSFTKADCEKFRNFAHTCTSFEVILKTPASKVQPPFRLYIAQRQRRKDGKQEPLCVIGEALCVRTETYFTAPDSNFQHMKLQLNPPVIYDKPRNFRGFRKQCISPKYPYCPGCPVGYEYIPEDEGEFYRQGEDCRTEWICLNSLKVLPKPWCYIEGEYAED